MTTPVQSLHTADQTLTTRYVSDFIPKFVNDETEIKFQQFNEIQYEGCLRATFLFYIFLQLILMLTEYFNDNLSNSALIIVLCRVSIIFIVLNGWWFTSANYLPYRRFVILLTLNCVSFMLLLLYTLVSYDYYLHRTVQESPYLYFWGACSGLLLSDASTTSLVHILMVSVLPFVFFFHGRYSDLHAPLRILFLPILHAVEMMYVQTIEIENRDRYMDQIERGHLLLCQDQLISSILPPEISEALKSSETNGISEMAAYYREVTILFCYIVDFSSHSSMIHPHDTVQLCLQIVSTFDQIVEQTGAYKVENIGDTYMACAGCPTETLDHSLIICRTAIAMMTAAQECSWKWPDGTPVSIKIGIHTGAVTAGIVGTKSYSYHLFGDTVNTASRMCSSSSPGKILLSSYAEEVMRLNHPGIFISHERGEVEVKGKGLMTLYWLDGFSSPEDWPSINRYATAPDSKLFDRLVCMRNFDSNVAVIPWKLRFGRKNSIFQRDATIHPFLSNNKIPTERDPTSELTFGNDADPFPEHQPSQDTLPGGDRGTKKPSPSKPSPSSEEEQTLEKSTNIRMEEKEISDIEIRFKENYAIKNVDRQSNMLGLLVIYYLLIFCDTFITNEPYLLRLVPLVLIAFVRILARRWSLFPYYSQKIIVIFSILLSAYTRYITSQNHNYASPPFAILYVLFTSLFLRLRFHYVLLYLILHVIAAFLISHFIRNNEHQSFIEIAYRTSSLIICGIVIYSHEFALRTEFIDVYILNKKLLKSEELLSNMLPSRKHAKLLLHGELVREYHENVSILYSDIKGFTPLASELHPLQLFQLLNKIYTAFDEYLAPFGLYKVDTIGDAFVVVGGMSLTDPSKNDNHVLNSIFFAFYMLECIRKVREKHGFNLQIRVGIHTGPCTGAVVSTNKPRYLVWGPSSITANNLESTGVPNCVHISSETLQRLDLENLKKYGILCHPNEASTQTPTYLLTCSGIEHLVIDTESPTEQKESGSTFSLALSRLKRISIGKRNDIKSPQSPKFDRLHLPVVNLFPTLQNQGSPSPQSPSTGRFFSSTARSYEPVVAYVNDSEGKEISMNTSGKRMKLSNHINPEPVCIPLNELHENSPHFEIPDGWC